MSADICIAISHSADFDLGTWTFEPIGAYECRSGRFAIILEEEYVAGIEQRDALLDAARAAEAIFAGQKWLPDSTDTEAVALRMLRAAIQKATGEQA